MTKEIHGHEVLNILATSKEPLTIEELKGAVAKKFGIDVIFHTCSMSGLTLDELLDFLISNDKIRRINGVLETIPSNICDND